MNNLYFSHVNVVDVNKGGILNDMNVLIEKGIISAIAKGELQHDKAEVINGQGKYLCPGVMDMHVHLVWDGSPDPVSSNIAEGPYIVSGK